MQKIKIIIATIILYLSLLISDNSFCQEVELLGPPGGDVTNLEISGIDPYVIYVSTTLNKGLFKSSNSGMKVNRIDFPFSNSHIEKLFAPISDTINLIIHNSIFGTFRTTDNGLTWLKLPLHSYYQNISFNPRNSSSLLAKKDGKELWNSTDMGDSWFKVKEFDTDIKSIKISMADTSVIYVATASGLFKSVNSGETWEKRNDIIGSQIEINPFSSNTIYLISSYLQKSIDGGLNFYPVLGPGVVHFKLNPIDTNVIYSVLYPAFDPPTISDLKGFFRSTDGGLNWLLLDDGLPDNYNSITALNCGMSDPVEIYIGIDNKGVFKSTNGGEGWQHTNLSFMPANNLITNKDNPDIIIAGNSWGIMKTIDGGKGWYYPFFDIQPENIWLISNTFDFNPYNKNEGYLAGTNYLFKTTDGGDNWIAQTNLNFKNVVCTFYHPFVPNTLFVLTNYGNFINKDSSEDWYNLGSNVSMINTRFNKTDINLLYNFALINYNPSTSSGDFVVLRSEDLGKTWESRTNGLLKSLESNKVVRINDVRVDINNPEIAYCGQSGRLSKTTNGGESWFPVDTTLKLLEPFIGISSIWIDPKKEGRLYVGVGGGGSFLSGEFTKGGLYLTEDDCKNWRKVYTVGGIKLIDSDEGNPSYIYFSTNYGVMRFLDTLTVTSIKENESSTPVDFALYQNYPNPFNPATVINYQLPKASHVTLKVFDILGREVKVLVNEFKEAGYHSVNFSVGTAGDASNLASGVYIYSIKAGEFTSSKKMLLAK